MRRINNSYMNFNYSKYDYLLERVENFLLTEAYIYDPTLKRSDIIVSKKAEKLLKKNRLLNEKYYNTEDQVFGYQPLKKVSSLGDFSFDFGSTISYSIRGLGTRDSKTKKFTLNWIGTHEEYNKIKGR